MKLPQFHFYFIINQLTNILFMKANKKYFSALNDKIKGKNVLVIPIVSSIDRKTGKYNLEADGNINRIITTFSYCDSYKTLKFILPKKRRIVSNSIIDRFSNSINNDGVSRCNIFYSPNFGIHAGEQRVNKEVFNSLYDEIKNELYKYDYIFIESQCLAKKLIDKGYANKMIFWNYTCEFVDDGVYYTGIEKSRSFLKGFDTINKYIMEHVNMTILASPEQVYYYTCYFGQDFVNKYTMYIPVFIDRDLPIFASYSKNDALENKLKSYNEGNDTTYYIYLPYRLTDEGYDIDRVIKFISYINKIRKKYKNKSALYILYGDPNNSGYMEKVKPYIDNDVKFEQVPIDRDTYYTLLDSDLHVMIPYFEDIEYINHASIQEFVSDKAKCQIILTPHESIDKSSIGLPYNLGDYTRVVVWAPTLPEVSKII